MCRCDDGPNDGPDRDPHADAVQQVEAEIQIAEQRAAASPRVTPGAPASVQLAQAAAVGLGRVMRALDRAAMDCEPGQDRDTRTPGEKARDLAIVEGAIAAARKQVCPTPGEQYLTMLAFATGVLMERQFRGEPACATEAAQRVALFDAWKLQRGRCCRPYEAEQLRHASESIWAATHDPTVSHGASWTARTVAA